MAESYTALPIDRLRGLAVDPRDRLRALPMARERVSSFRESSDGTEISVTFRTLPGDKQLTTRTICLEFGYHNGFAQWRVVDEFITHRPGHFESRKAAG